MKPHRTNLQKHSILLAVVLLLLGQFVSLSHSHEINQNTLDADDCLICMIGNAGADALPSALTLLVSFFALSILFTAAKTTGNKTSYLTIYHKRAPPYFS